MPALPVAARRYVVGVALAALVLVIIASTKIDPGEIGDVALLAALYVGCASLSARGASDNASIALGSVVALAAYPLVGAWGAVLVAAPSGLAAVGSKGVVKRTFNGAQLAVSAAAGGAVYTLLGGEIGFSGDSFPGILLPVLAADVVHCLVNGLLVAVVITLTQRVPMRVVLQGTMSRSVVAYLGYGLFGLLLAVLWDAGGVGIGPFAAVLVLLPLLVARWAYSQYAEQQGAYDRTVRALVQAVETKDYYTRGHSERVATASVMIARVVGMREDRVESLRYAGILHDVGKLGVPTRVLQKSGRLTEEELAAVALHPVRGLEMVREIDFLKEAFAGIMHHHERLDGTGYPMGLQGSQIPEFARVISVADAFDSMTSTRSYRGARTVADAVAELRRCAGTQFDPVMVDALIIALERHGWAHVEDGEPAGVDGRDCEVLVDADSRERFDHDDPQASAVPVGAVASGQSLDEGAG